MLLFCAARERRWAPLLLVCLLVSGCAHERLTAGDFTQSILTVAGFGSGIPRSTPISGAWKQTTDEPTRWRAMAPEPGGDDPLCGTSAKWLQNLTLGQAVMRTICANPTAAEAFHAVNADMAQYKASIAQFLPSATLTSQRAQNTNRSVSVFGPSRTSDQGNSASVVINWLLWDFGGRKAQVDSAAHTAIAAMASEDAAIQASIAAVSEAFLSTLAFTDMQRVTQRSIVTAQATLAVAKSRRELGAGTSVDVEFARLGVEQAKLAHARAMEQIATSRGELATIMNLPPNTSTELARNGDAAHLEQMTASLTKDLEKVLQELERHGEIRAAQERAAVAENQIAIVRSELYPKVNVTANYFFNGRPGSSVADAGTRERFIGLSLTVPITDPFTAYQKNQNAIAQYRRAGAQVEGVRRRIQTTFWRGLQTLESSAAITRSAAQAERHAREAEKQAEERYRLGAADVSEWLRAQKALADAQAELVKARADVQLARVRILVSLGRLAPWRLAGSPASPKLAKLRLSPRDGT